MSCAIIPLKAHRWDAKNQLTISPGSRLLDPDTLTLNPGGFGMKKLLLTSLVILALAGTAVAADRIVHYEHFTADW